MHSSRKIPAAWRYAAIFLACALSISCCAHAQQSTPEPISPVPLLHISSNLVLLDVLAAERKTGWLIPHLTANDFILREDGVPQKISYFSQNKLPLSIVLLFDLTDSVRPEMKDLAAGALDALKHLKPEDEVAVMVFSSSARTLQPFTKDRAAVAAAIQQAALMKSDEATFLDEDVYEGAETALTSTIPDSRRVLVFFTDGTANFVNPLTRKFYGKQAPARLHSESEVLQRLLESGVVVSALIDRWAATNAIIATEAVNPLSYLFGTAPRLNGIERYATQTGGPVLHGSGHRVAEKLAALIEEIRGRYTIGYVPSAGQPAGKFCRLQLKLKSQAFITHPELKHGRYIVATRAGYYR